ncbi:hypothetical protein [Moorena sp. SIO3B2]|uniref:hypothetical protein n=1 Tax=Moorena sp. SIO3B2 TaxID=2607827 RepID=UPI0013C93C9E|nr:hypothetical protein [Moorena sp. SIO3B2]NEP30449.1 hypothetical protein [Moorena sp. SIO3B2]
MANRHARRVQPSKPSTFNLQPWPIGTRVAFNLQNLQPSTFNLQPSTLLPSNQNL